MIHKTLIILFSLYAAFVPAVFAGELLLYTSQPAKDAQKTVETFMAAHPGTDVKWFRDGTTKLMTKLRAELATGRVQPDLLLISDMVTLESLKQENLLLAYKSPEAVNFEAGLYDPQGYYYSTKLITTGIVYNTRAPFTPRHWADLIRPECKNQVAMPSPLYSGAALIHLATLTANPKLGWEYYENLNQNQARAKGGNGGTFKAVASGEKPYGMVVDFMAIRAKAKGSPVNFVFPEEGCSFVTEPVAIMAGTKHLSAARSFVDFLLSKQGQNLVKTQGYIPARKDTGAPDGFPARSEIRTMAFSPAKALADTEKNKQRFSRIWKIRE